MDLFTERLKLKDIFPERAKKLSKEINQKADDIDYIRKGIPIGSEDISIKKGERAVIRYITTANLDRDNEIVVPSGALLEDFRANPSVLYAHKYSDLPVGKDIWIKVDGKGVIAKTVYAKHQFADDVYNLIADDFLRASSIGFVPIKSVEKKDKEWKTVAEMLMKDYGIDEESIESAQRIYTKWLLLEHSDVPVPSNPQALNLAISKGEVKIYSEQIKKDLELEIVEKPETTENYHRIPVRECKITATIDISKKQGIKALYCGKIKKVATYLFDKDKWTMADAKKWVKEHEKAVERLIEKSKIKHADTEGNPSVEDITQAIYEYIKNPVDGKPYKWVVDLYPTDYPNGHVIICVNDGENKYYFYPYTYDDGKIEFGEPVEYELTYEPVEREKNYIDNTGGFKITGIETIEEKEGRVLSTKNRKLIKTCIDELQKLYEATETLEPTKTIMGEQNELIIEPNFKEEISVEKINEIIKIQSDKTKVQFLTELNNIKENINKILVNKLGVV